MAVLCTFCFFFFFSSRRRHTRCGRDWSSDVCSSDLFERLFARALELQQAGDLLGAIDTYKSALLFLPDRADALSNLGAAYVRLGQYEIGRASCRERV